MRLVIKFSLWIAVVVMALVVSPSAPLVSPTSAFAQPKPPNPEDILGTIEVVAGGGSGIPLPKIAVEPSLSSDIEDVTLRSVMRRDLELSGEFEVLPDSSAPDGLYLSDTPVDVKAWKGKGAEAIVKVTGKPTGKGFAELRAQAFFVKYGEDPVFDKRYRVEVKSLRVEAHRVADKVIGALTGQDGSFASHLTFASGTGKLRRIFTIDADGHDAKGVSPPDRTALAPAYGPNDELYYAASIDKDEYKLFTQTAGPIPVAVRGSIYGLAWNKDYTQVALSIGVGSTIKVFSGPNLQSLPNESKVGMALRPAFTPSGLLAFAGEGKWSQRIYVGDKAISPDGLWASAPTFCRNPNGVRAIFMVGAGKATDLVATGEQGGKLYRLTQGAGRNSYPACSPDGRLVAFFSTRKSGEGPGLYVMRVDGGRAKRISPLDGDSLRWAMRPEGTAVELGAAGGGKKAPADGTPEADKTAPKPAPAPPAPAPAKP